MMCFVYTFGAIADLSITPKSIFKTISGYNIQATSKGDSGVNNRLIALKVSNDAV